MGRPIKDLSNQQFDRLKVLQRDLTKPSGAGKSAYWLCECKCGNIVSIRSDKLTKGEIKSCGCLSKEIRTQLFLIDLTDQYFGKLHVIKRDLSKPMGKSCFASWICECECGNIVSVRGDHLRDKTTQSCGCLNSAGELKISQILQENNINYKTQYSFNNLKGDYNQLRFDFAIFNEIGELQNLIEFQGKQHYRPWGNETAERFEKRLEYDKKKQEYCQESNIPLIIIPYNKKDYLTLADLIITKEII